MKKVKFKNKHKRIVTPIKGEDDMRKIILTISIAIVTCSILYICAMVKDVENVRQDFFNVVCDKMVNGVDYGKLERYYRAKRFEIKTVDNLKLEIDFLWHNFKEGYMNVLYSYDINKNDVNNTVGAGRVESKWYIRKEGTRWIVYDIYELP